MNLAMDLAALCDTWRNDRCHLAIFSVDIDFACHFMATRPPLPYGTASGIGYASKKL